MTDIGVDVRKLVALDMAFHGKRFIVLEFAAGVVLCAAIGLLSTAAGLRMLNRGVTWQLLLGVALLWIALNYVPLFIHAIRLATLGTAAEEVSRELADARLARSYSWRQLWILVPFAILLQDLRQRSKRSA